MDSIGFTVFLMFLVGLLAGIILGSSVERWMNGR